ncbi:MAG: TonB-dependent receptor [Tsuneonella sp.]
MLRAALLAGAALAAAPTAVFAQDTGPTSEDGNVTGVGEIIVTAQRREQNLQDVPAAVTALTGDALQQRQITDATDLQNTIPSVVISAGTGTSNSARIYFRGIGEDESRGAIDPAVGIYIDDVYLGRTVGSLVDLLDVAQVEALRGPQGTLYGRNTNGGAIKVTSVRPKLGVNSLEGEVGYGNFDRMQAKATANLAAWDSGALRISGLYRQRDGYFTANPNGALASLAGTRLGDEEVYALRASFYGELSPDWSFLAIVDYTKDNSDPVPSSVIDRSDNPAVVTDRDQNIFTIEPPPNVTCGAATTSIGCFTGYRSEVDAFGVSYQLKGDIGAATITSTTAYRTLKDDLASHITFPYFQKTDQNQFSQELLVNTRLGAIDLTGGAFYYSEDAELAFTFIFPVDIETKTDSFALFGQASAELGPVTLTGGLRWTTEDRTITSNAGGPLAAFGTNIVRAFDTDNVTWTTKASYDLTDDIMLYASYATGSKSPGGSADCFSPLGCFLPVNEEKIDAIEGGLRAQFGPATFNATYFYNDYQDLQISGTLPNGAFTRINAGKARIQGVELEFGLTLFTGLSVYGNASWLDGKYTSVDFNQAGLLTGSTNAVRGATCTNATPGTTAYQQQVIDCALGLKLKNAPEWKGLLGFNYGFDMGGGEVFFGADAAYESDSFALVSNVPGSLVEPGVRIDARAGWKAPDDRWSVTVWGKNLTDREYFRATTSVNQVYPAPPLTFGIDVGFKFD